MAKKELKRTYYPQKTFDDDLAGLAKLFEEQKWSFSGIDTNQLIANAESQRKEREEHDRTERVYLALHETFGLAQEKRHELFSTALKAASAAFRKDKAMTAVLVGFKRSVRKAKKDDPDDLTKK